MDQKTAITDSNHNALYRLGMHYDALFNIAKSKIIPLFLYLSLVFIIFFIAFPVLASDTPSINKGQLGFVEGSDKTNIIPLFNNRFRLDANLEEITMIFYRERGSKPVILIRPDGSKIRVIDLDNSKVQWFDDTTFDMIKIQKPMPGPWQAIGDIKSNSKIFIVSNVKIAVEPLPDIVFKGETLKVTGKLFNGEHAIDVPDFRDVVTLEVHFFSENKVDDENFGAEAVKVTTFKDDGQMLDEYAGDGVFTGEFALNLAAGAWRPTYLVKLPMAMRELSQTPIQLYNAPISVDVKVSHKEGINHQLKLKLSSDLIDVESILIDGKIVFPDRQIERFSITEGRGSYRTKEITFTESGIYRVDINAFGKTIDGRDIRLTLEQYTFSVDSKLIRQNDRSLTNSSSEGGSPNSAESKANRILNEIASEQRIKQEQLVAKKQKLKEETKFNNIMMIILVNSIIIVIAIILFFIIRRKKVPK